MVIKDSVIIQALQKNCNTGGDLLFDRYYKPLVLFADSLITDRVFAEDLVQEVFYRFMKERVYENIVPDALGTYLFRAVKNICVNSLNAKREVYSELEVLRCDAVEEESKTIDPELIVAIYKAIEDLPAKTRIVVQEILIKGRKYKEVAEENGTSVNTVKTLLSSGLKVLRNAFSDSSILCLFIKYVLNGKN